MALALAQFEWRGHKVNLSTRPASPTSSARSPPPCAVADLAVFVVSAVDGVEVQTEIIWQMAASVGVPRAVFVNKLDRERADFDAALAQLQERFGAGIAPLELPIGAEAAFRGVADLLTDTAYVYEAGSATEVPIPDDLADREHEVHDTLVEGIVVGRRRPAREVPRGRASPPPSELAKALGQRRGPGHRVPRGVRLGHPRVGVDRLLDLHLRGRPLAPRPRRPHRASPAASAIEVDARPRRRPPGLRVQVDRRPPRRASCR